MSKGMDKKPIIPSIKDEAKIFGIIPKILNFIDLNKIINIKNIKIITNPRDFICESNRVSSILLYKTSNPLTLNLFIEVKFFSFIKNSTYFINFFLLIFSESMTLADILAIFLSINKYG